MMRLKHRHEGMDPAVDARMAALRKEVRTLLNPEEGKHGGDRKSEEYQVDNINLKTSGGLTPTTSSAASSVTKTNTLDSPTVS
jgi:hypothetical protein